MRMTPESSWRYLPQPFLAREANAAGLSSTSIAGAVRRRHIIPVASSVYAVPEVWVDLSPKELHINPTRAASVSVDDGVVSHQSAALLHGLPHPLGPMGPVSLTLPDSCRTARHDDWRRLLDAELPESHVTEHSGIALTTVDRTVVDCFRQLRLRDALAVADGALRAGATTLDALQAMRAFQTRWPGVTNADTGIALADPRRESWLESASVATAHVLGFSRPMSHVWIHHLNGRLIGRVDLLWPHAGVIGEADGHGKYLGEYDPSDWDVNEAAAHMVAERDRERELESVGFAVARWGTGALLRRGGDLRDALLTARRRADPSRIRCLWRQDPGEELRPWSLAAMPTGVDDGPFAA
jgi:hypothetical protein